MNKFITLFIAVLSVVLFGTMTSTTARAASISIAPLEYRTSLKQGEYQKGFVDIVNPDSTKTRIQLHVQAFRQVNDQGGLEFYDSPEIAAGVQLDLDTIDLGPGEGARVYFRLDASKLPSGDVFAAIIAGPASSNKNVLTVPSAHAGTLLMIVNGTPPDHHAEVQSIDANWLQIGDVVTARLLVKNTDKSGSSAIGFSPDITVAMQPYSSRVVDGPLVFAGRSREVAYREAGSYFGLVVIRASIGTDSVSRVVFLVTGYWRWLAPLILVAILVALVTGRRMLSHSKNHNKKYLK